MSIKLTLKEVASPAEYFESENDIAKAYKLKDMFRRMISDEDAKNNILENMEFTFKDRQIYAFLSDAISDINSGQPRTGYTISGINDDIFVVKGAMVMALVARGILETKNSLSYTDQGLSINTFDKGQHYQSWSGVISATYERTKVEYKSAEVYRNMFTGIRSEYSNPGRRY